MWVRHGSNMSADGKVGKYAFYVRRSVRLHVNRNISGILQ